MNDDLTVSIDGPTASGKTTLGVSLASDFGGIFVDTGLTYRALAYALTKAELPRDGSWKSFIRHSPQNCESPSAASSDHETVYYEGENITGELWSFDVDNHLEKIARNPQRRHEIADYHCELIAMHNTVIVAGRDIAATILADATLHIFLNADFAIRRERRRAQHRRHPERSVVVGAVTNRDLETLAQISMKSNSLIVDTTHLSPGIVLMQAESWLRKRGKYL
jgi:cytidylate kinase